MFKNELLIVHILFGAIIESIGATKRYNRNKLIITDDWFRFSFCFRQNESVGTADDCDFTGICFLLLIAYEYKNISDG